MPPRRPSGRSLGPAMPLPVKSSTRTPLHTQQLLLFSSPISATPAKRSTSRNKRTESSHAVGARQAGRSRSLTQHRQTPSSTTSREWTNDTPAEYEPLPEEYHAAPCPSSKESFSITVPPRAAVTANGNGVRVPLPPPRPKIPPENSTSLTATAATTALPIMASGAGSRVIRLLRDARAAVQDPIRPETPLEAFAALPSLSTGASADDRRPSRTAAPFPARRSCRLEGRSQRRLPAGWRLAPIAPPSSASALSSSGAALERARGSATVSLTASNAANAMSSNADASSSGSHKSPMLPTGMLEPPCHLNADTDANSEQAGQSPAESRSHDIDPQEFSELYHMAQQAGDSKIEQAVDLLLQLKQWLLTSLRSTGKTPVLDGGSVACLQTTVLHFCKYWPTGATLRQAMEDRTSRNSNIEDAQRAEDSRASTSASPILVPLLYAQRAFLAAIIMLQSFPVTALVAEPVSFESIVRTLHILAEAGFAELIAREANALRALVEALGLLAGPELGTQPQAVQWLKWVLDTVVLCCEDAADAADATTSHGVPPGAEDVNAPPLRQRLHSTGSSSPMSRPFSGCGETDVIRGSGLVDDEAQNQLRSTQRWQRSCNVRPSSLNLRPRPVNNASFADTISSGSPMSFIQSGNGEAGFSPFTLLPPCTAPEENQNLYTRLVHLDFLPILRQISDHALAQCAASPPTDVLAPLLPVVGTIYRCFARSHPEELRGLGVLGTLTSMLNICAADTATVEVAARTLVKLTYIDECLEDMQEGTTVIAAAAHALRSQLLRTHAEAPQESSIDLLVSRLCGVIARVAEDSTEQQEYLVSTPMVHLLEDLAARYVTVAGPSDAELGSFSDSLSLPPTPVLQAVVWVLGIASMSPHCPLQLVRSVTPPLVRLLEVLRRRPSMQLTAVYVLMCLSNLSYFFGAFEFAEQACSEDDGGDTSDWLPPLYSSLGLLLAHYLFEDNVEATVEATRILGNISYTNAGRDWMEANHCDEVVVLFLGHEDLRIVYNCCGVLLNLTAASPCHLVQDPELFQTMLSYTSRYTDQARVEAVTALEEARLRQGLQWEQQQRSGDVEELASEASSQVSQIAHIVEKLLLNVHGDLHTSAI
ncbi:hypothetical protein, conserved [Leishmania tarentolae]|uniref:Uncharacterized protein n=1 Tax=Leishmania tarentolae TaxID=5689 RepID=A0A640KQQ6_LEITA|nr:hypothetical protein, conserved [Leishmania tarentolae]